MMKHLLRYKWLIVTCFIWIIILGLPELRYQLRVAKQGSPWMQFTLVPPQFDDDVSFSKLPNPPLPMQVRKLQMEENADFPRTTRTLTRFDELIKQHPDSPWLIAMRLRQTIALFTRNRQGGDFADVRNYEEIQKGKPSIERNDNVLNYTPQQMRETLELCKRGEQLEPQNAYFTWLRIYFLMADWQDAKAIAAVNEAASKSYFDSHHAEYYQHYFKAATNILQRPLTSYETVAAIPHETNFYNAQMREMARILSWQCVKMRRAGDDAAAMTYSANAYHIMTLAIQGNSSLSDFLLDYAVASILTVGPSYPSHTGKTEKLIKHFIDAANKINRPDLAQQIARDWKSNSQTFQNAQAYIKYHSHWDSSLALINSVFIMLQCTVLIILSISGAFVGWILLAGIRLLLRVKSTFPNQTISSADQSKAMLASSGCMSFVLAALFLSIIVSIAHTITYGELGWGWGLFDILQHPTTFNSFADIIDTLSHTGYINFYPTFWRILVAMTPIICGVLFALMYIHDKSRKSTFPQRLGSNIYRALLFLAWGIIAMTSQYALPQTTLAIICGVFLLVSIFIMWRKAQHQRNTIIPLIQISLSRWICTGSILVLLLLIGQTILNNKLQPWADHYLHGEMTFRHPVPNTPPQ